MTSDLKTIAVYLNKVDEGVRDKLMLPLPPIFSELYELIYQLDLTTPGSKPSCAHSLNTLRDKPKSR
jgi:hypothetical protein